MLSTAECDHITASIQATSASVEARFVDIGGRLGTAVDTIAVLSETFDRLANELQGENLHDATRALSQIMDRVAALAHGRDDEHAAFGKLATLTTGVQRRVAQIGKVVDGIGMLAINARIEAVAIGDAGLDFAVFTTEIGRTLALAQSSLASFNAELVGVSAHLHLGAASQIEAAQRQAVAIESIPARLETSIGTINDRSTRAVAAACAVAQKSRQVGQSISDAVMALQVGDITRQRLQHIEYGLSVVSDVFGGKSGDWSSLSKPQRHSLIAFCCGLLSAQLLDASDEFSREVRRILSSIQKLAADAQDILRLGQAAAGPAGDRRGTFLREVEGQVAEVSALFDGLRTARHEADQVAESVSHSTTRLVAYTSTLNSLEEDIRLMGLNTSLKCGRLGAVGRPLMVIAQELRAYSGQIAAEAGVITVNLDAMVATAGSLAGGEQEERAADIAAAADTLSDSTARLGAAGESLADALTALAHDTDSVAVMLRETVSRATVHEELATVLQQLASDLGSVRAEHGPRDDIATAATGRMLDLMMRSYTMERERAVHNRYAHGHTGDIASQPVPTQANAFPADSLEDVFF